MSEWLTMEHMQHVGIGILMEISTWTCYFVEVGRVGGRAVWQLIAG